MTLIQCDCCDFFTIPEGEDYEICPVCFWEQDGFGLTELSEPSGANHGLTLLQGRANFREFGACEKHFVESVVSEIERTKYFYAARTPEF
jgi:Cysteine-rich CPCC